ncbi:hypothetical protein AGMMS49975_07500 [Clostridia bacterium]|nr:hypothetical protein AGMMS49975_07500 [Clostridia bacterium]
MDTLLNKIKHYELFSKEHTSVKAAIFLIYRYICVYVIFNEKKYLDRAYSEARAIRAFNGASSELKLMTAFIELLLGNAAGAGDILRDFYLYKNYMNQNEPKNYNTYIFLSALRDLKSDKVKSANKKIKILDESVDIDVALYIAYIQMYEGKSQDAYHTLAPLARISPRGFLVNVCLYLLFSERRVKDSSCLFPPFAAWCVKEGIDFGERCLDDYRHSLMPKQNLNFPLLKQIYAQYPKDWLLDIICTISISKRDYTLEAYHYYRAAASKQRDSDKILKLESSLLQSAFINQKEEKLSHFTMERFLRHPSNLEDANVKAFVYHILISQENLNDFADKQKPAIISFAANCLEIGERGRYFNSIYSYFLRNASGKEYEARLKKCAEILYADLTVYEGIVPDSEVAAVWVFDKEKTGHEAFFVTSAKVRVKSVSDKILYICFAKDGKTIVDSNIKFKKIVAQSYSLCRYLAKLHPEDENLAILLARLALADIDAHDAREPFLVKECEEYIEILSRVQNLPRVCENFNMQTAAALGNLLAKLNRFDKAIEYYTSVNENYLNDDYIEQMLVAFMAANEYDAALSLVLKKSHCVQEQTLCDCVTKIIAYDKKYHKQLADTCYELILKSYYKTEFMDIVTAYYNGSLRDFLELARVPQIPPTLELDRRILLGSVETHSLCADAQRIFVRMYANVYEANADILNLFVYFLCYSAIVKNTKLESKTLSVLEKHYEHTGDSVTLIAITHLYINHKMYNTVSDKLLVCAAAFMERADLYFPCMKDCIDKKISNTYIQRSLILRHETLPDKNVFAYYKTEQNHTYRVKMKYFRFGIYLCTLPHFYGETISYYFAEETSGGSITTKEQEESNTRAIKSDDTTDEFFAINNALIYEQMYRWELSETIISDLLHNKKTVMAELL